jgi:hypothetical protein
VSSPPADVLVAIVLAVAGGTVLLLGLVVTALVLRQISVRLAALHEALGSIGTITDPLTGRIGGIGSNVSRLREAATVLAQLVNSRTGAADVRD